MLHNNTWEIEYNTKASQDRSAALAEPAARGAPKHIPPLASPAGREEPCCCCSLGCSFPFYGVVTPLPSIYSGHQEGAADVHGTAGWQPGVQSTYNPNRLNDGAVHE